jgi:DNA-binding NarL/FixJ family response regulator
MTDIPVQSKLRAEQSKTISILIADDHPLVRKALRFVLQDQDDFEVIAEASDGEEAVELTEKLHPNVVIMDISMPKLNGLEATKIIKSKLPGTVILVLTVHGEADHIIGILEAGAAGYLTKTAFGEEVVQSIRSVIAGETVLNSSAAEQLLKFGRRIAAKPIQLQGGEKLSSREVEILRLVARGMSNKDIASALELTLGTVKGYLVTVFSKLAVSSRTEAIMKSLRAGIITVEALKNE